MVDNTHVRGVDNSTYTLYTSDVYSRYRNSFSLSLEGEEDIPTTSITDNLQAAFLNYSDCKYASFNWSIVHNEW